MISCLCKLRSFKLKKNKLFIHSSSSILYLNKKVFICLPLIRTTKVLKACLLSTSPYNDFVFLFMFLTHQFLDIIEVAKLLYMFSLFIEFIYILHRVKHVDVKSWKVRSDIETFKKKNFY